MESNEPAHSGEVGKRAVQGQAEYVDATAENEDRVVQNILPAHGHNASSQQDVRQNQDLALHFSHEHQHKHIHHSERAEAGRLDEVVYSKDTTFGKAHGSHVPDQVHEDQQLHHRHHEKDTATSDSEKGVLEMASSDEEDSEKKHKFSRFYARYRIFFHLFIWLLFTGYVIPLLLYA